MNLKEGLKFKSVTLDVDPIKISFTEALDEAKKLQDSLNDDCVIKFEYCSQKVVLGNK